MYDDFYYLSVSPKRNVCVVQTEEPIDSTALFRGEYLPAKPIVYHQVLGGKPKHVLETTHCTPDIFSHRVVELLAAHQITGWSTFPVEVVDNKGEHLPGYVGFSVTGRCGPIDDTKRRMEYRTSPYNPNYSYYVGIGLYFDLNSWDGSDIFTPQGGVTLVVGKVKQLLEKEKITEFIFTNVNDYELADVRL